ncbi:hypothetical protein BGZ46_005709, partial [Entomortierella lignicola]
VDTRTIVGPIHVDVMSLFRAYIIATETSIQTRIAKKEARVPGSTANETPALYLANALETKLAKFFRKADDILHFDGAPTYEKANTRSKRDTQRQAQLVKAGNLFDQAIALLPAPSISAMVPPGGVLPIPCTRSRRQKVVKLSKLALRNWKYARTFGTATKTNLVGHLTNSGWTVCQCAGEADVCISRQLGPTPGRHVVVASSDSDFLFHRVRTLLRQDPQRRSTFLRIDIMNDIVNRLGITEDIWILTGMFSKNDYSGSLLGLGFSRTYELVKEKSNPPNPTDRRVIQRICQFKGIPVPVFDHHYIHDFAIFRHLRENIQAVVPVDNNAIDGKSVSMIEGIELLFRQYKDYHRAQRALAPAPAVPAAAPAAALPAAAPPPAATAPAAPALAAAPPPAAAAPAPAPTPAPPAALSRPFLKYMPPNKYNAQVFNLADGNDGN